MDKQFILPFRLGEKQLRAVLDANGQEVVIFPEGCEYLASEYVENINDTLHSYKLGKTAGEIAQQVGCCEQWPNCEGHMDSHEEIFAKEVIENLLKEVEPIKEEKSQKTGDPISLINAIKRTNGDFS